MCPRREGEESSGVNFIFTRTRRLLTQTHHKISRTNNPLHPSSPLGTTSFHGTAVLPALLWRVTGWEGFYLRGIKGLYKLVARRKQVDIRSLLGPVEPSQMNYLWGILGLGEPIWRTLGNLEPSQTKTSNYRELWAVGQVLMTFKDRIQG